MFNFDVNALAESIKPAAEKMAASLGTSLDSLWTIGVKGQIAEGIGYLAIGGFLSILYSVVAIFCMKLIKADKNYDRESATVVLVFATAIFVIVLPLLVYYGLLHVLAPEWSLLMEIKSAVQNS